MRDRSIRTAIPLLLTVMLIACSGEGNNGGTGPSPVLSVTLRNNHTLEIQILASNETYADENRIAPGGNRVVSVPDAQVGGNVTFRVGRNNRDIASQSCSMARDTRNPEVHWNGSILVCTNW